MFEIRKTDMYRSCAKCNAANYESQYTTREKVDTIYEIIIGHMCNALCPDCMKALAVQITDELERS